MAAAPPALIVQQKLPALTRFVTLTRARGWSQQGGVRWPHRRRADSIFVLTFAGGAGAEAIDRSIDVDRLLSSYGVSFDNTRFAAALRLVASSARAPHWRQRRRR